MGKTYGKECLLFGPFLISSPAFLAFAVAALLLRFPYARILRSPGLIESCLLVPTSRLWERIPSIARNILGPGACSCPDVLGCFQLPSIPPHRDQYG